VIRAAGEGVVDVQRQHLFPGDAVPTAEAAETFQQATRRFQATLLRKVLHETDWNVPEAARRLDVARSHFYGLIRALGITRERS
jgi:DNA-binding NtrC family response regulator